MYSRYKESIRWFGTTIHINENFSGGRGHFFPRGAVRTVLFGENVGFEKSGTRPALCISNDTNNRNSGNIAVAPLTDKTNKAGKPLLSTQYVLNQSKYAFLRLDSIVQCEDIRVVSKSRIGNVIGFIDASDIRNIEKRLKTFFAL